MSDYLIERIRKNEAISLEFGSEVTALHGEAALEAVTLPGRYGCSRRRASS
jgi:thioredoxin reductase (NADPH)